MKDSDWKALEPVVNDAKIQSIAFVHLHSTLLTSRVDLLEAPNVQIQIHTESEHNFNAKSGELRVLARCELTFTDETPQEHLHIALTLELNYALSRRHTKKGRELFATANAMHNAWPFFREAVQNVMLRMGLPPYTLPLFTLSPPATSSKKQRKKR